MFALTSGTTNRPKTIPVTAESLADYRDGLDDLGHPGFRRPSPRSSSAGSMPILQLASDWRESFTPAGIPCGAITGLTAQMQNPLIRITYCMPPSASKIKDVESKYYLALRLSSLPGPRRHRSPPTRARSSPSPGSAIARRKR